MHKHPRFYSWLFPLLSRQVLRRLLGAAAGLVFGVPSIFLTLRGTSLMETEMLAGRPWGSGLGGALLFVGIALYGVVVTAAGVLSACAFLPLVVCYWVICVSSVLQRMPELWQVSMSIGWSSYIAMSMGMAVGAAYSVWQTRRRMRPDKWVWFTWDFKQSRSARFYAAAISALACLSILLLTARQAGDLTLMPGGEVVVTPNGSLLNLLITVLLGVAAGFVAFASYISELGSLLASLLLLVLPSLVASGVQLFALGFDPTSPRINLWSVSSPILGVLGTQLVIGVLSTTWARHFPSVKPRSR